MKRPVSFYSEGMKLDGDLFLPDDIAAGEKRAGIVLCHGYTGVKDLYLPDNARVLNLAGYVVLTFDYKGWGKSEGPRTRLDPHGRVADVQAAMTFLGLQPEVDESTPATSDTAPAPLSARRAAVRSRAGPAVRARSPARRARPRSVRPPRWR